MNHFTSKATLWIAVALLVGLVAIVNPLVSVPTAHAAPPTTPTWPPHKTSTTLFVASGSLDPFALLLVTVIDTEFAGTPTPVSHGPVELWVDGQMTKRTTPDAAGRASFTIPFQHSGDYQVSVRYNQDPLYATFLYLPSSSPVLVLSAVIPHH